MNAHTSEKALGQEQTLGEFLLAKEKLGAKEALLIFIQRFPELKAKFEEMLEAEDLLALAPEKPIGPRVKKIGEYDIRREIQVSMGEVYEAYHERLQRRVVVKVNRPGDADRDREAQARFLREQKILAKLHQTNIVPIFAAGEDDGLQYIVMQYIDGASLNEILQAIRGEKQRATIRASSLKQLANQVAEAMAQTRLQFAASVSTLVSSLAPVARSPSEPDAGTSPPSQLPRPPQNQAVPAEYIRSVAQALAGAADAIHHAHEAGVIHRDIKPGNLMTDKDGQCHVIDFGLAGLVDAKLEADLLLPLGPSPTAIHGPLTRHPLGTPEYMAPEIWAIDLTRKSGFRGDRRSDVWSLGATLYELLTTRRAFPGNDSKEIKHQVSNKDHPVAPRALVKNLPKDLQAICLKALHKEPAARYQTAKDFADDLRRWLNGEPTLAHPWRTLRRPWSWAKRNSGWASTIAAGLLSLVGFLLAGALLQKSFADQATAQRNHETQRREDAEKRERATNYEHKRRDLQQMLLTLHESGWSKAAEALVFEATKFRRDDERLKNQAAALLFGLDAQIHKKFPFGGSAVAFNPGGKRLLIGGLDLGMGGKGDPARLWDFSPAAPVASNQVGFGPVAFHAKDDAPLQLFTRGKQVAAKDVAVTPKLYELVFLLWNVEKHQKVSEFQFPEKATGVSRPALSADGKYAAASAKLAGNAKTVLVWETDSAKVVHEFPMEATAIGLYPKEDLIVAGDDQGQITVWSFATGKEMAKLPGNRMQVHCVALTRDPVLSTDSPNWLLATGDAGANIVVWDLTRKTARSFCRGSGDQVNSVAFSPDGITLASCGRGDTRLWDVQTGRPLLNLRGGEYQWGVAFSPDGKQLAATSMAAFGPDVESYVWDLQNGRGIQTLRGLVGHIPQVRFSRDGKLLAAVSDNWQVGIWEAATSRLLHILNAPRGYHADNAGFGFSHDNKQFAFATGREAALWNLENGKVQKRWKLPVGKVDHLAFTPSGKLLLFREESTDPEVLFGSDFRQYPRICRVRDLLRSKPLEPILELKEFNRHVYNAALSKDGKYLAIEGLEGEKRWVRAYNLETGKRLWEKSPKRKGDGSQLCFDPTGRILGTPVDDYGNNDNSGTLFETETGKEIGTVKQSQNCVSPGGLFAGSNGNRGFHLFRRGDAKPLVTLGLDVQARSVAPDFNSAGTHLAWGNEDGTVFLADLNEVQRRLAQFGMGW